MSPATLLTLSKTLRSSQNHLHRRLCSSINSPLTRSLSGRVLTRRRLAAVELSKSVPLLSLRILCAVVPSVRCVSGSAASFASGGGGVGGGSGGGGDGGGDGSEGGNSKVGGVYGAANDVSALSPDVILLDVRGMTCGGCAASVKRILESQPQVASASVNLATETAIVWPASEAKVVPNWQKEVGEILAKQLTTCGFESNFRGPGDKEGNVP